MKKWLPAACCVLVILFSVFLYNRGKVIAKGEYYSVALTPVALTPKKEYTITIRSSRLSVRKTIISRTGEPVIIEREDGMLEIRIPLNGDEYQCRFYDPSTDELSRAFISPLAAEHGRVALVERKNGVACVVVRDIFSGETALAIRCDFAPYPSLQTAVHEARFLSARELEVTYEMGPNYKVVTEVFNI